MGRGARVLTKAVHAYQLARGDRLSPCRFLPSCSNYALEAIELHGALRGGWLATRRVCRCNPLGGHGVDLVPEPITTTPAKTSTPAKTMRTTQRV